ncbi:T9SS type A sorting domain-containing protein [candidate division KSB1 bacterium]|nr:T9SS type A sorting domain-containing protein [candidate division KSB1 bacterium]
MNRIIIILCLLSAGSFIHAEHGFFAETWQSKQFVAPESTMPLTDEIGSTDVTITVSANDTLIKILPSIFGNNTNAWIGANIGTDPYALRHLNNAKISFLRLPGGNWSNEWLWDGEIHWDLKEDYENDIRSRPTINWSRTTEEMLDLAMAIDAEPQICVNYSLARYIDEENPVQKAAQYAAEWVMDVNIDQGLGVRYWEVGNENYGSWQAGYEVEGVKITGQEYGRDFCVFVDSMKAVDPSVKIGAVLYESASGSNVSNWTQDVLAEAKDHADFLIIHDYFTWAPNYNDVTVQQVLNGVDNISEDIHNVETMVEQNTGYPAGTYPITMTEYNMRAGWKNNSFLCAIFITEALGELIQNGYALANLWDIANGYNAEGGDHGMLSRNDPDVQDYTPHPSFYPFYYYDTCFGDVMISVESDDADVAVYASRFDNEYLGLVIVNESSDAKAVSIIPDGFPTGDSRLFRYELTAEEITSLSFTINEQGSTQGKFGPEFYDEINPYEQQISDNPVLNIVGTSINFLVIEQGVDTDVHTSGPRDFEIEIYAYPNPFNPKTTIHFSLESQDDIELILYNIRGERIRTLAAGKFEEGEHHISLDGSNLSSGIYIVQLITNFKNVNKKISLIQ